MFLARLTSQLISAVPCAGLSRSWPGSGLIGSHAFRPLYSLQPASPSRAASLPSKGAQLDLEQFLVPRKMAISPLESWLTARHLLPGLDVEAPMTPAPSQFYKCPPSHGEEEAKRGVTDVWDATPLQCKNVLKIRRRKINHHKYRKLIKRTRFLRWKVREGRLKRKQIKFEKDLKSIWLKAGLKEAPES
ncbi:aurora kinase A-interacting protein-like [Acomys russatus]|uniref:aurora kinase A-interacting protein-like n=1 Tax=Acomys russatus TaxID=60746 RepID=UPI0021E2C7B7|nr:aurora kinase A-interacting protein-like [Acomys russatus]